MTQKTRLLITIGAIALAVAILAVALAQCGGQPAPAATISVETVFPAASPSPSPLASDETMTPAPSNISDDVPMIRIPAGEFIAGTQYDDVLQFHEQLREWASNQRHLSGPLPNYADEIPRRTVCLDEFYIDKFEVTNARYRRCVEAGACDAPLSTQYDDPAYADHPVGGIKWSDADAFCRWAGKRLPAELEWEKAARGTDGRLWPWGSKWDENTHDRLNQEMMPVGAFPADVSLYGVMDMAGNVWEWTADWYLPYPGALYQSEDFGQVFRVVRGGGSSTISELQMRTAVRLHYLPETALPSIGFRCAQGGNAPTPQPTYTPQPTGTPDPALLAQRDVVLVPAGEFVMGDDGGDPDARPEHVVYLDAFYIDRLEVTNAQYAVFLNEIGQNQWACSGVDCASVSYGEGGSIYYEGGQFKVAEGRENLPAGFVSWYGADAYCSHYSMRLPTEAEWEKAARGTDGRKWPWGDEWDPDKVATASDRPVDPLAVGSRPEGASPYGVLDMIGNVNEWTNDWYSTDYYQESPYRNPPGPATGTGKVVRGAGSMSTRTSRWDRIAGTAMRTHGTPDISHSGFRCAYNAGEEDK